MKFISTKAHGVIDYLMGILLIAAPWLLGFYAGGAETWIPVAIGAGTILFSLLTNYELGAVKKIPMKVHLAIDFMAGLLLAISPWLFDFDEYVYLPHLVLGITELLVVMCSASVPYAKPRVVGYPPSSTQPR